MPCPHQDIAVVGAGVAGMTAAFLLHTRHKVTLYEKNDYLGGHTHTVRIPDGPDAGTPVDTGFIVLNDRTYPLFNRLLRRLEVAIQPSDMSFSYQWRRSGFTYASRNLSALFAQRRNLLSPPHLYMLLEILRFNLTTRQALRCGALENLTLGDYLRRQKFSRLFRERYILPMAAAIWSAPDETMTRFPAEAFARFFDNHGLLSVADQPQWYFVAGGSQTYVAAFAKRFGGEIRLATPVTGVAHTPAGVRLRLADGSVRDHEAVVMAAHADQALKLLENPAAEEKRLLAPWRYSRNEVVLHRDPSFMPSNRRAWASWNYIRQADPYHRDRIVLTYHMNRLQRLATRHQYFVTLNPPRAIAPSERVASFVYHHPIYTFQSLATQRDLGRLNRGGRILYCGSYHGYGFHEDAVRSAVAVGQLLGGEW